MTTLVELYQSQRVANRESTNQSLRQTRCRCVSLTRSTPLLVFSSIETSHISAVFSSWYLLYTRGRVMSIFDLGTHHMCHRYAGLVRKYWCIQPKPCHMWYSQCIGLLWSLRWRNDVLWEEQITSSNVVSDRPSFGSKSPPSSSIGLANLEMGILSLMQLLLSFRQSLGEWMWNFQFP